MKFLEWKNGYEQLHKIRPGSGEHNPIDSSLVELSVTFSEQRQKVFKFSPGREFWQQSAIFIRPREYVAFEDFKYE